MMMAGKLKYADLLKTATEPPLFLVHVRAYEFGADGASVVSGSCPSNWLGVEETAFRGELDNHDAVQYVRSVPIPDDALEDGDETVDPNYHWPDVFPEMTSPHPTG
jgi:hypothetical protein